MSIQEIKQNAAFHRVQELARLAELAEALGERELATMAKDLLRIAEREME
jgi:hypothetical protein